MILKSILIGSVVAYFMTLTGGQICIDNTNVNRIGNALISSGRQVIVPSARFNCNGRITSVAVSMRGQSGDNFPQFQVWHPTSPNSNNYNRIGNVKLPEGNFVRVGLIGLRSYFSASVSLNSSSQIEFQSGDVIGYYQPSDPSRLIWSIQTSGYTSYSNTVTTPSTSIDINNVNNTETNRQPLIAVTFDIRCDNLSTPANGNISCNSGRIGVGYEGDTCSFTCNTGYELTGCDTRTCQSNGSWSGSDGDCRRVSCTTQLNVNFNCPNGTTTGVFEDFCTFTCIEGYELQGPSNGTCLANGSWSEGNPTCVLLCPIPLNGYVDCGRGNNCNFSCDPGYMQGSVTSGTCESNGSWNVQQPSCVPLSCPNVTGMLGNGVIVPSCELQYQSQCTVSCDEGFTGDDVTYLCNVTSDPTIVRWVPIGGVDVMCERVQCHDLVDGILQCPNGATAGVFEDTCTFSCNTGFGLQGSNNRTCLANQSWSGGDPVCKQLGCSNITMVADDIITPSLCNMTYQSQCTVSCDEGFTGDDVSYFCNATSDPTMVDWIPIGGVDVTCERVQCHDLMNGILQCPNGATIGVFQDTCTFSCNAGYELQGSNNGTCLANQSWSGGDPTCVALNCLTSPPLNNSQLQSSCDTWYQSTCTTVCVDGYTGVGGSYTCVVTDEDTNSVGWSGSTSCQRVNCSALNHPMNGIINCSLGDDGFHSYENTCSFTCNTGYELTGSDTRTCQSDGSWSDSDVLCTSTLTGDNEPTSSVAGVIGGTIGGVFLLIIIAVVLVVMLRIRKSQKRKQYSINYETYNAIHANNKVSTLCVNNQMYEASITSPQPDYTYTYEEADFSSSHRYSVVEKALSTMHRTRPLSATPYEEPVSGQPGCATNLYEMPSASPYEMAESIETEQQIYETPCEGEENIGPIYCLPPADEQKIYEEFEGKRFCKIHKEELTTLGELGSGEFGVVTHGKWTPSPHKEVEVAIKELNPNASDKDRLRFLQEAAIMCQFDHGNVVKLHGVVTETPRMIVLEYMSHGDLRNLLLQLQSSQVHPRLQVVLLKFCKEIAAGMAYLSGKHFIHRDLAARNILVSETITCKIADFGMSRDLIDENYYVTSGGKIPVKWTAPEALLYRKYSVYSDVWSYGCVLYEIWSLGHKPFEALATDETIVKTESGYRLPPPPGCTRAIYRTMIKCWNPDPRSRPQFGQLVNVLASNSGYLLGWSDEDKQACSKEAMTLGSPLEAASNLYCDLQLTYTHTH